MANPRKKKAQKMGVKATIAAFVASTNKLSDEEFVECCQFFIDQNANAKPWFVTEFRNIVDVPIDGRYFMLFDAFEKESARRGLKSAWDSMIDV